MIKVQDIQGILDELQSVFPDFKLDPPTKELISQYFDPSDELQSTDFSITNFVDMLMLLTKSSENSYDGSSEFMDRLQEMFEDKEDKIADLTDQLENLMEENKTLKEDINDFERKELTYRKQILELERKVNVSSRRGQLSGGLEGPALRSEDVRDLLVELRQCPVHEIKNTVTGFVDELLDKTLQIGQERLKLYDQVAPILEKNNANEAIVPTLLDAFDDIQESYKLQSELLEIYEGMKPTMSKPIVDQQTTVQSTDVQERIKGIERNISLLRDNLSDVPHMERSSGWKSSAALVLYSLFLWFLGIITSLAIAEFLANSSWALESGLSPVYSKVVF